MEINHRIEFVSGAFNTETGKLVCVKSPKYGRVELCFAASMNIPFARIKLHSKDLAVDADAVLDDAYRLGREIARRWNVGNDIADLARAALEALEGTSGAGASEIYRFPAALALHDRVFDPSRLDDEVRAELNPHGGSES